MKSSRNEILYIGKAVAIRKRIYSHFRSKCFPRGGHFLKNVAGIEYHLCDTEEQALILEASLIKEYRPKYNIDLKDDKSYPYVVITNECFPRVLIQRKKDMNEGIVFGPYTNVALLRNALKMIRKIFPFCTCRKPRKSCLYVHLRLCPGPELEGYSYSQYQENIENIRQVLSGERKELIEKLQKRMQEFSSQHNYEDAARLRDQLVSLFTLYSGRKQVHELLLMKEVLRLPKIPFKIEAIDISCLSGKEAAGAVVTFFDGVPDKSNYRRYKIKGDSAPDDLKMIEEVVQRRFARLKEANKKFPDLLIIDGGVQHVKRAKTQVAQLSVEIAVIGIAKRNEEIWFPEADQPLIIPKDNPALQLIQRIRDEAHRFAHTYHTLLRKKKKLSLGKKIKNRK